MRTQTELRPVGRKGSDDGVFAVSLMPSGCDEVGHATEDQMQIYGQPVLDRNTRTYGGGLVSTPNTGIRRVRPIHPGEMLREDFLPDYEFTVSGLADAIGVSRQTINEVLRERRAVSPQMALRLGRLFGNSPAFWLNAQREVDLWDAAQEIGAEVDRIRPVAIA